MKKENKSEWEMLKENLCELDEMEFASARDKMFEEIDSILSSEEKRIRAEERERIRGEMKKLIKREYLRGRIDAHSDILPHGYGITELDARYEKYIEDNPTVLFDVEQKLFEDEVKE